MSQEMRQGTHKTLSSLWVPAQQEFSGSSYKHVFGDMLSLSRCYDWFGRFKSNNFDLKDRSRSSRPEEVDNDVLEDLITADPRLSSVELSAILSFYQTTIWDHLKAIGKGFWYHTSCHQKIPYRELQFAHHCSLGNNCNRFSSVLLPQMRNGFSLSMLSAKDNGWTKAKSPTDGKTWSPPEESSPLCLVRFQRCGLPWIVRSESDNHCWYVLPTIGSREDIIGHQVTCPDKQMWGNPSTDQGKTRYCKDHPTKTKVLWMGGSATSSIFSRYCSIRLLVISLSLCRPLRKKL